MTKAPELKPCPFCGGLDLTEDRLGRICCDKCGATAPYGYKVDKGWNIRADLHVKVKPLPLLERRNGYWGGRCSFGYQVAHTQGDTYRVRLNGKVILREIKGFQNACRWANSHHRETILSALEPAPMTPAQAAKDALISAAYSVEKRAEEIVQKHLAVSAFNELRDVAKGLRAMAEGGA